jgi:hypothetical protein
MKNFKINQQLGFAAALNMFLAPLLLIALLYIFVMYLPFFSALVL